MQHRIQSLYSRSSKSKEREETDIATKHMWYGECQGGEKLRMWRKYTKEAVKLSLEQFRKRLLDEATSRPNLETAERMS